MTTILGQPIDDLEFSLTGNRRARLADFRDAYADFTGLDTLILGASRDGLKAQENFKAKQGFPFDLVADTDEALCRLFDVIKLKKLYGRESLGVERSTFLIDGEGVLRREWRNVKVKGHVQAVLEAIRELTPGL